MNTPLSWRELEWLEVAFDPADHRVVHEVRRADHSVRVLENERYRWLAFDDFVQSAILVEHPHDLLFNYARTMLGFRLFVGLPARALLLGLGGGSLVRFLARYVPALRVTAVDYSADVVALARDHFGLPPTSPQFELVLGDAREHLRDAPGAENAILIDLADPTGTPDWLEQDAFHAACRARLAPDGIVAFNLVIDEDAQLARLLAPLERVYGGRVLHTGCDDYQNVVAFAFNGALPALDAPALADKAMVLERELGLPFPALLGELRDGA